MTRISLQRGAERRVQPWKNGMGKTTEIAVFPPDAGLEDFDWRVSMASVTMPGPFSQFAGVDRILAVIEGRLELGFDDEERRIELTSDRPPHAFPGDVAVTGKPVDGAVVDLNLMVRRGRWTGMMERLAAPVSASVTLASPCVMIVSVGKGHLRWQSDAVPMQACDAIRLDDAEGETVVLKGDNNFYVLTLRPTAPSGR